MIADGKVQGENHDNQIPLLSLPRPTSTPGRKQRQETVNTQMGTDVRWEIFDNNIAGRLPILTEKFRRIDELL